MTTSKKPFRFKLPEISLFKRKAKGKTDAQPDEPRKPRTLAKVGIPWKQLVLIGGVVMLGLTMLSLNSRLNEYARLTGERDTLSTQIGGLYNTKVALETQLAMVESDAEVVNAAREAHMLREGEKLLVVMTPPNNTPIVQATPVAAQTKAAPKPWEIWLALFFGE